MKTLPFNEPPRGLSVLETLIVLTALVLMVGVMVPNMPNMPAISSPAISSLIRLSIDKLMTSKDVPTLLLSDHDTAPSRNTQEDSPPTSPPQDEQTLHEQPNGPPKAPSPASASLSGLPGYSAGRVTESMPANSPTKPVHPTGKRRTMSL
jgi:hypothetical protein